MFRWRTAKPTGEDIAVDRYWDELVHREPGAPVPFPPKPTELTTLINQLTAEHEALADTPASNDPMLLRVLARQRETKAMNMAASSDHSIHWPPVAADRRRSHWWGRAPIAALFAAAVLLIALTVWRHDQPGSPGSPAGLATPSTGTPDAGAISRTDLQNRGATFVWRIGAENEALSYPMDVAVGMDGNIWVVEAGRNQIRIYSPEGVLLDTWGESGSGPGQFNFEQEPGVEDSAQGAIAFAPDGTFFVVDAGNFRVQKFAADRTFMLEFGSRGGGPGQFAAPSSIAITADGTVFVQDFNRDLIQAFDSDGNFLRRVGKRGDGAVEFANTGWITADPNGTLWSGDWGNNRVQNFTTDGVLVTGWGVPGTQPGEFSEIAEATSDGKGHVFTSEWLLNNVQVFDTNGNVLSIIMDLDGVGFMMPAGVALDDSGSLYVADFGRGQILKYAIDYTQLGPAVPPKQLISPDDTGSPSVSGSSQGRADFQWTTADQDVPSGVGVSLTIAPDGSIWMADAASGSFRIYDGDGVFVEDWGEAGSGPGEFRFQEDRFFADLYEQSGSVLFLNDGSFLVADPGNGRVQRFDANRAYLGEFGKSGEKDAIVERMGELFALPDGLIGVSDYPLTFGLPVELVVFTVEGEFVERRTLEGTYLLAVDGEVGYWSMDATSSNLPRKYAWDGSKIGEIDRTKADDLVLGIANDLAFDAAGNIYTAGTWNHRVSVFRPDGTYIMSFTGEDSSVGMFWAPTRIEIAPDGSIVVLDSRSMNISSYNVVVP